MKRIKKRKTKSFLFKPFSPKQLKLLWWWKDGSPYIDYDMVIADGAIRSGKTISMICSFLQWSQENFKGESFIVAGKSIGALKRNVINPMIQILTAWGWKYEYNRSENYLIIGWNTYYLFGANKENSQDTLQGLTAAGALADEVALFPQSFVDQMIGRCSVDGAKIFMNCNPGSPYHFVKIELIDKKKEKMIYYLHFTMDDNLSLSQKVKERFKRMFSGVFFLRYIQGLWVMAEGVIYDNFDKDKMVVDLPLETVYEQYYVSIDYGTQNPTVFKLWAFYQGVWYCIKEYYYSGREKAKQKTDEEFSKDLQEFVGALPVTVILDPSAASFRAQLRKDGFRVRKAKNDVLNGIRSMQTAMNEGIVKWSSDCVHTFREFHSYVWDEKAAERGEDKPVKEHDHCMDADRYFIHTIIKKPGGVRVWK
ncbi:PBSX family phage terminase large subunit [Bacillaceae bacterium Marseille-Q3522]|nr:PBSX family phage terminase large subunit [Bacillaceae bacterium Marseille-Q3522]